MITASYCYNSFILEIFTISQLILTTKNDTNWTEPNLKSFYRGVVWRISAVHFPRKALSQETNEPQIQRAPKSTCHQYWKGVSFHIHKYPLKQILSGGSIKHRMSSHFLMQILMQNWILTQLLMLTGKRANLV